MGRAISRLLLKWWGWSIPAHVSLPSKYVMIVIPHTSNWDFMVGVLARSALNLKISFIGKHSLFRPPLGWLFRWLGGVPVDRSRRNKMVDQIARIYKQREQFAVCLAPEGTRSKVTQLKSGFYYIALEAQVPIIMVKFDWSKKVIGFAPPFLPTGDKAADFQKINEYYKGVKGKNAALSYTP